MRLTHAADSEPQALAAVEVLEGEFQPLQPRVVLLARCDPHRVELLHQRVAAVAGVSDVVRQDQRDHQHHDH